MMKRFNRRARNERGQSVIELALLMPFLLLLLAGVLDFGRAFNNSIIITNASREAARYGSKYPWASTGTESIPGAAIAEAASSGVTLTEANVSWAVVPGTAGASCPADPAAVPDYDYTGTECYIEVTVTFPFTTFLGGITGYNVLTLTGTTEMVIFGGGVPSTS